MHADVVRVGALRRIDKRLLPYSLHAVDSKASGDAIAELKDMLAASASAAEAAVIQKELDLAKQVLLLTFHSHALPYALCTVKRSWTWPNKCCQGFAHSSVTHSFHRLYVQLRSYIIQKADNM